MLGALGVSNFYSRLSSDYYIADIALEYLDDGALIVLSTQSKHFKNKAYNLLFKRQQHKTSISKQSKKLTIIPKEIKYLKNVQILYLSWNQIQEIPETIGQLINLEELSFSRNHIQDIPNTIGQLTNLCSLDLSGNQIRDVPHTIGQLTNLKALYLDKNQIQEIPETIGQLTNLTHLSLFNNPIEIMSDLSHLINCKIIK